MGSLGFGVFKTGLRFRDHGIFVSREPGRPRPARAVRVDSLAERVALEPRLDAEQARQATA
jgi:hypothetical protein